MRGWGSGWRGVNCWAGRRGRSLVREAGLVDVGGISNVSEEVGKSDGLLLVQDTTGQIGLKMRSHGKYPLFE